MLALVRGSRRVRFVCPPIPPPPPPHHSVLRLPSLAPAPLSAGNSSGLDGTGGGGSTLLPLQYAWEVHCPGSISSEVGRPDGRKKA